MSQTSCARCHFPAAIRWLNADGNLSRPNTIDHCAVRALIRSEQPPKSLPHPAHLPYVLTRRSIPVSITSTTELGAGIKSP
jgi:hypothetical protein